MLLSQLPEPPRMMSARSPNFVICSSTCAFSTASLPCWYSHAGDTSSPAARAVAIRRCMLPISLWIAEYAVEYERTIADAARRSLVSSSALNACVCSYRFTPRSYTSPENDYGPHDGGPRLLRVAAAG